MEITKIGIGWKGRIDVLVDVGSEPWLLRCYAVSLPVCSKLHQPMMIFIRAYILSTVWQVPSSSFSNLGLIMMCFLTLIHDSLIFLTEWLTLITEVLLQSLLLACTSNRMEILPRPPNGRIKKGAEVGRLTQWWNMTGAGEV